MFLEVSSPSLDICIEERDVAPHGAPEGSLRLHEKQHQGTCRNIKEHYGTLKRGGHMKIEGYEAKVLKIKTRKGYAAVCCDHLTEGKTQMEAIDRMEKALRRKTKRTK